MNVLDLNTPVPELIKAMKENPELFYEQAIEDTECLFDIEPALRFVLSYWADPRPVSPRHIMSLVIQLVQKELDPSDDEGQAILMEHAKAMGDALVTIYKREEAAFI